MNSTPGFSIARLSDTVTRLQGGRHLATPGGRMRWAWALAQAALFAFALPLWGQVKFVPPSSDPILDPWRWREIEPLGALSIRCLDESSGGVLWLGTDSGLFSYDGYFVTGYPLATDEAVIDLRVLRENEVHFRTETAWGRMVGEEVEWLLEFEEPSLNPHGLAVDGRGGVYLGVAQGLFHFGSALRKLETVFDSVDSVAVSGPGRVWIAESGTGRVAAYSVFDDGRLGETPIFLSESLLETPQRAFRLFLDSGQNVWLLSELPNVPPRYFTPDLVAVEQEDLRKVGGNNAIWGVAEGHDGALWLAAQRTLHRFQEGRWDVIDRSLVDVPSSQPMLHRLKDGSMLVTGRRDAVAVVDRSSSRFGGYEGLIFQCQSESGSRWFLARNGLVGRQSADGESWDWFSSANGVPDTPNQVVASSGGTIWVAGSHRGAACVARFDGEDWVRDLFPSMGFVTSHLSGFETRDGEILFGMSSAEGIPGDWSGGMVRYLPQDGDYLAKKEIPPAVPYRVESISEEDSGALLVGGANLRRVSEAGVESLKVPSLEYPGWWVDHIAKDWKGSHWVSLWGLGVYRFKEGEWEVFNEEAGLPSDQVAFALPSRHWDGIWVATRKGVFRYDFHTWTEALPASISVQREGATLVEEPNGDLWINIASRSWFFRSEIGTVVDGPFRSIRYTRESDAPRVEIKTVPQAGSFGGEVYFEWEGVDFWSVTPKGALEYSYQLDGGGWSPFSRQRNAVVLVEEPGDHRFEVRVRDRDWNLSEFPARVAFRTLAPLWQRPWFIATTLAILLLVGSLSVLLVRNRIRHALEVESLKVQFFTYLSHELRTPLSVVLGPIESAMKRIEDSEALEKLSMAKKNARRVLTLVDQLLDLRKFEYEKKCYAPSVSDLKVFVADCVESIRPLSEEKCQRLVLDARFDEGMYPFDGDMLQKILSNLLSNAIKYSPGGSLVEVTASLTGAAEALRLELSVTDEGPGIEAEAQRMVFEPFYRLSRDRSSRIGAGLGLALVKDLVDAWGGTIEIESPVDRSGGEHAGTCFRVVLPLRTAAGPAASKLQRETEGDKGKLLLLLVDDDADFLAYLSSELSGIYKVIAASDGDRALELAKENMPAIVVADFHMPGMSGGALCRALKEDMDTCHIPVLVITSDVSSETKLAIVRSNADSVLQKPVPTELLVARLRGLLETRERLRELFSRQVNVSPKQVAVTSTDEALLQRAIDLVESNMEDESFDVEQFSKKMAMSSRTLYRKLSAVTGMTPVSFVRSIRLKRAAQLFEGGVTSVSEAMVRVGILDASYFSRVFKKEFGKTPSQFIADCGRTEK